MRKSISDVTIIKILKKPTSQKYLQRTVFYIYIFLILIVHECFTAEELDNFLFTIFTFKSGQNGGKIIGTFKKRAPRFRETDTLPGRTIMPLLHLGNYGCLSFNYMAAYPTLHNHVPVDKNDVSCQGPAGRAPFGSGGKVT